ncbi:hypothetical protein BJX62DRAFT_173731 [Aspergillus germanicus]
MAGNPTSKNLIAVVIGAVILFGAISIIPLVIMRRHRRRAAARHANELHCLEINGTIRQVSVQRWLDQQQTTATATSENFERYADESCFGPTHPAPSVSRPSLRRPRYRSPAPPCTTLKIAAIKPCLSPHPRKQPTFHIPINAGQ